MKALKTLGMTIVTALLATVATAQTNLYFLASKSALRSYAIEQARTAQIQMYCNSQVQYPLGQGVILPTNHTSLDIIRFFTNTPMSVTILNLKDYVWLNGWVSNPDGDILFYASSVSYPTLGAGGYRVPFYALITLSSSIPVKFDKAVDSAQFLDVDSTSGQTTWSQYLGVYGNKVYFNSDYAGHGYLIVTMKDGTKRSYDLGNGGAQMQGTLVSGLVSSASIENLVSYSNTLSLVSDVIPSYNGIGQNKTYEFVQNYNTNLVSGVVLAFAITTSEGYSPLGYWVRQSGTPLWQFKPAATNANTTINFGPVGTWYVIPEWDDSQFREPDPVPPWYYGGATGTAEKG